MHIDQSWIYPGTVVILLILAYMQWQINAKKTMIIVLLILGYIVYSHETGHTLTELKEEAVNSFDEAVGNSKYKKDVVSDQMRPESAEKAVE